MLLTNREYPMPTNFCETKRNEWIDAPDTKGREIALRVALIVIFVAIGLIIHSASA